MPVSKIAAATQWYDTPNIHLCTVKDFEDLCDEGRRRDPRRARARTRDADHHLLPNLLGSLGVFRFRRKP